MPLRAHFSSPNLLESSDCSFDGTGLRNTKTRVKLSDLTGIYKIEFFIRFYEFAFIRHITPTSLWLWACDVTVLCVGPWVLSLCACAEVYVCVFMRICVSPYVPVLGVRMFVSSRTVCFKICAVGFARPFRSYLWFASRPALCAIAIP